MFYKDLSVGWNEERLEMTDEKRLSLMEKLVIIAFGVAIAYFIVTVGLSLDGVDRPWPFPIR